MTMREREMETAKRFGVLDKMEKLEKDLLSVKNASDFIDFDLDGFYDDMKQVIVIIGYDIPVGTENYFEVRRRFVMDVLEVAMKNGLTKTEDRIEDYGESFYIVFKHDDTWGIDLSEYVIVSKEDKDFIRRHFKKEDINRKGKKIFRGFIGDNTQLWRYEMDKLELTTHFGFYYSGYAKNDSKQIIYTWCEGDTTIQLFNNSVDYYREVYECEKFYMENN